MVSVGSKSRSAPATVVLPVVSISEWEYVCPNAAQVPAGCGIRLPVWLTQPTGVAATGAAATWGAVRDGAFPVDAQPTIQHAAPSAIHLVM